MSLGRLTALTFLSLGTFALMQVFLPVASYQVWELALRYSNQLLISPQSSQSQVLGISIETKDSFPAIVSELRRGRVAPFTQFSLSIPKINLEEIPVLVDSNDFSKTLAHLPGSALPGEKGNLFITGHSASGFLFKKQEDYFAKLPSIKKGDEIIAAVGGSKFKYTVIELKIVSPTDLSVINPADASGRYISLNTCVPPGINTKRLIVIGKII